MNSSKKLFLGLLLSSALIQATPPIEINMKSVGIAGLLVLAQMFRANPPAQNAPVSEHKMYRNVRVGIGVAGAGLLACIPDGYTRAAIAFTGVGIGEICRVLTSSDPKAKIQYEEPLLYAAILTGGSTAFNMAGKAVTVRY